MNSVINIAIDTISPFLYQHRYVFMFLGALFEGTNIMLLGGFLYKLELFKFWYLFLTLLTGYILNGYMWYIIGRWGGRSILEKWGSRFFLTKERINKLESYFEKRTVKTLLIARVTYGLGAYVFVLAGIFKTKVKIFFWCNFTASIVWVLMMLGIGYSFGASYEALSSIVRLVAVWLVVALFIVTILIAVSLVFWLRKSARKKFLDKITNYKGWKTLRWLGEKLYKFLDDNV